MGGRGGERASGRAGGRVGEGSLLSNKMFCFENVLVYDNFFPLNLDSCILCLSKLYLHV